MRLRLPVILRGLLAAIALTCLCGGASADAIQVSITNSQSSAVHISFTNSTQSAGIVSWNPGGCAKPSTTAHASSATIKPGQTCVATVDSSNGSSRFCADSKHAPANCWDAQTNHQTLIETNFLPSTDGGCFGQGSCVWYDISVIPSACTDELWKQDECANTGGASYNLPVSLSCAGNASMPTYVCQGPRNQTYGPAKYPSHCGNPNATCAVGTTQNGKPCVDGVATYFYPMFVPPENAWQPNAVCLKGNLAIQFLAGK